MNIPTKFIHSLFNKSYTAEERLLNDKMYAHLEAQLVLYSFCVLEELRHVRGVNME